MLRPEVVGVCGSDVHLFHGRLGQVFPRIQGHEISAVVEAVGPGSDRVRAGDRVAVWPVLACGACYPCSIGRENVCANIAIIGAHVDGALQERLVRPGVAGLRRGRHGAGGDGLRRAGLDRRAHGGAGARDAPAIASSSSAPGRSARPSASPRATGAPPCCWPTGVPERLEHARAMGAQEVVCGDAAAVAGQVREWAGGDGVAVLIETTGVPAVVRSAFDVIAPAGRLVLVALSHEEVSLPLVRLPDQGARRPRRELLQRERVRRRGRPRAPQRGRRRAADHRRVRLRAGARGARATSPAARRS